MKNKFRIIAISLTLGFIFGLSTVSIPQPPPPPNHGNTGDTAPGGMAPVGSGLILMLSLGAAYGAKKVFNARKRLEE